MSEDNIPKWFHDHAVTNSKEHRELANAVTEIGTDVKWIKIIGLMILGTIFTAVIKYLFFT